MLKKNYVKTFAIALCATVMSGIYATDAMAADEYYTKQQTNIKIASVERNFNTKLDAAVKKVEGGLGSAFTSIDNVKKEVAEKADAKDVFTKEQTNIKIAGVERDFGTKLDAAVNKVEGGLNSAFAGIDDVKKEVAEKADAKDVFTKEQSKINMGRLENKLTNKIGDVEHIATEASKSLSDLEVKVQLDEQKNEAALQDHENRLDANQREIDSLEDHNIDQDKAIEANKDAIRGNQILNNKKNAEQDAVLADHENRLDANQREIDSLEDHNIDQDKAIEANKDAIRGNQILNNKRNAEQDAVLADHGTRLDDLEEADKVLGGRIDRLDGKVDEVAAGAAALAALHPMEYDPEDKLSFAAGVGNYGSETASALGLFYRPDEKVMFSASSTVGYNRNLINVGASFALDRTPAHTNPKALGEEVLDLRERLAAQEAENDELAAEVKELRAMIEDMKK